VIHVDRSRVPEPPSLCAAGVDERARAKAFYADPGNRNRSFEFKAYKARDVVNALEQLFHQKCAYCESFYGATQPADIEHFRPKGAVMIERPGERPVRRKPGYYWLAAEWDNLLPSCIDCNRARTQEFDDDDVTLVRGKENRFPLEDESKRSEDPEDVVLAGEGRLLLHPCRDRPEEHIEFLASGLIREREESSLGRTTIDVLGLQRKTLKEMRRAQLEHMAHKMHDLLTIVEQFDDAFSTELEAKIELRLRRLRQMADATQPYAGAIRHHVAGFEAALVNRTAHAFVADVLADVTADELI
jgi:uncharacterized protein (TIGR02646 family)